MRKFFKWLLAGVGILILACLVFGAVLYVILIRTVPEDNNKVVLAGLDAGVSVVFDRESIPHIKAGSSRDAARTLGFVHARERLWQMEFLRMVGQGRLSEMFGGKTVDTDIFLRTLGMADASRKSFEKLQPETREILEAYAAGVNAYVARDTRLFEPSIGVEFLILGHTPEQWEAWQSVLILKVMGLTLAGNMDREIQRFTLAANGFSPREIDDMVPYGPRDNPPPLPSLPAIYQFEAFGKVAGLDGNKTARGSAKFEMLWPTGQTASNNWVISGSRTQSGKPILANDPHLGLTTPSAFYLAHMRFEHEGGDVDVIGGTLPGIPFVIAGRNNKLAWGLTTTGLDAQDLFIEKINPDDQNSYRTETGWLKFQHSKEEILVSDGESVELNRQVTRHGPVLPASFRKLDKILPENHVLSLQWTGLAEDDTTLDTLYANSLADNVAGFIHETRHAVSPMQSVVVADTKGNIAVVAPGRVPVRSAGNLIRGRAPVPGWLAEYQWQGTLLPHEVPRITNPAAGAITTANANFLPETYDKHITYDWAEHFRQARAERLVIAANEVHTIERSKEIIADKTSDALVRLRDIARQTMPSGIGKHSEILAALRNWDGRMEREKPEPLIMLAWFRHLHELMLKDDLGENYDLFKRGRITRLLRMLEISGARDWCNNKDTPEAESCSDILAQALDHAVIELAKLQGDNWGRWQYGKSHVAYNEHRPFGSVPPLDGLFNVEVPSSGGPYTLMRGQTDFGKPGPYRSRHASAYRAIYDFGNLDKSLYMQSTGQSGNFMSRFYRNFSDRWAKAEFVTISSRPQDYSQEAQGTWQFTP